MSHSLKMTVDSTLVWLKIVIVNHQSIKQWPEFNITKNQISNEANRKIDGSTTINCSYVSPK